jgi:tetratricopeptide (TPR) repeat protein
VRLPTRAGRPRGWKGEGDRGSFDQKLVMAAPVPATKLDEYAAKLLDLTHPLSEIEIWRILQEMDRAKKSLPAEDLWRVYSLVGTAYQKLRKFDEALVAHRTADRLRPSVETKTNIGAALLELRRPADAIEYLAEAAELNDQNVVVLMNLCICLASLGSLEDAREIFLRAVEVADFKDPQSLFLLAVMASSSACDAEAAELFARYLALQRGVSLAERDALEFIRDSPEELMVPLKDMPALARSIKRAIVLGPEAQRFRMLGAVPVVELTVDAEDGETADDVLAWTRPYRARANAAALEGHGDE